MLFEIRSFREKDSGDNGDSEAIKRVLFLVVGPLKNANRQKFVAGLRDAFSRSMQTAHPTQEWATKAVLLNRPKAEKWSAVLKYEFNSKDRTGLKKEMSSREFLNMLLDISRITESYVADFCRSAAAAKN